MFGDNRRTFDSIETRVVKVNSGDGMAHAIKIDNFDSEGTHALEDKGYGGNYYQYSVMGPGIVESHYDAFKLCRESRQLQMNEAAQELIRGLHTGGITWEQIHHDDVLFDIDIKDMKDGSG